MVRLVNIDLFLKFIGLIPRRVLKSSVEIIAVFRLVNINLISEIIGRGGFVWFI